MLTRRNSAAFAVGLTFVTLAAFAQSSATTGANTTVLLQLPPAGLAASETAQVNIINTALPLPGPEPYCGATIVFYGGKDGDSILGTPAAFNVRFFQVFSVTLPYASTGASGSRTVIRVRITLSPVFLPSDSGPQIGPCTLVSSLETYDTATGVTHAFFSAPAAQGPTGAPAQQAGSIPVDSNRPEGE
jgi:hypothetical protein